jgi:hypothetical protein
MRSVTVTRRGLIVGTVAALVAPVSPPADPLFRFSDGNVSWHLSNGYERLRIARRHGIQLHQYVIQIKSSWSATKGKTC